MMTIHEKIAAFSSITKEELETLSDNELDLFVRQSKIIDLARSIVVRRRVEAQSRESVRLQEARKNFAAIVSENVNRVKDLKEYSELCMLGSLMLHAEKRKDEASAIAILNKIEETLAAHNMNEPRIVAHIMRMGGER